MSGRASVFEGFYSLEANLIASLDDVVVVRKPINVSTKTLAYGLAAAAVCALIAWQMDAQLSGQAAVMESKLADAVKEVSKLGGEGGKSLVSQAATSIEGASKSNSALNLLLGDTLACIDHSIALQTVHAESGTDGKLHVRGTARAANLADATTFRTRLSEHLSKAEAGLTSVERSLDPLKPGINFQFEVVAKIP
ncbi:MAG: hypothetical protein ABUL72_05115 [Armatimonadota bacterium]